MQPHKYLQEGNDFCHDGFDLTIQLLGVDLRAAHIASCTFCSQTHTKVTFYSEAAKLNSEGTVNDRAGAGP